MLSLRAFVRSFFAQLPLTFSEPCLETTWKMVAQAQAYDPPRPTLIAKAIRRLADFDTKDNYLRTVEHAYGLRGYFCSFVRERVYRPALGKQENVVVLRIDDPAALSMFDEDMAADLMEGWMRFDAVGHYRVATKDSQRMLYYDTANRRGVYWASDGADRPLDIREWSIRTRAWDACLDELESAATVLDAHAPLPITESLVNHRS